VSTAPAPTMPTDPSVDPHLYRIEGARVVILGSRSDQTGSHFWPRRLGCPETGGTVSDAELPDTGTVWSWTYVHAPWAGIAAPSTTRGYAAGLVDLDGDGPRVIGVLMGEQGDWEVGARVRAVPLPFRGAGDDVQSMLAFERATA